MTASKFVTSCYCTTVSNNLNEDKLRVRLEGGEKHMKSNFRIHNFHVLVWGSINQEIWVKHQSM